MKPIIMLLCLTHAAIGLLAQSLSGSSNDPIMFPDGVIFRVKTRTNDINIAGVIQQRIEKDVYRFAIGPLNTNYVINIETGDISSVSNFTTEEEGERRNTRLIGMIVYEADISATSYTPGTNVLIGVVGRRNFMGQITQLRPRRGFKVVLFGDQGYYLDIRNRRISSTNIPGYRVGDRVHMINIMQEASRKRF